MLKLLLQYLCRQVSTIALLHLRVRHRRHVAQVADLVRDLLLQCIVNLLESVVRRVIVESVQFFLARDEDVRGFDVEMDELHGVYVSVWIKLAVGYEHMKVLDATIMYMYVCIHTVDLRLHVVRVYGVQAQLVPCLHYCYCYSWWSLRYGGVPPAGPAASPRYSTRSG